MPWTVLSFKKHYHAPTAQGVRAANDALSRGLSDVSAIRIGISVSKKSKRRSRQ